MDKEIIERVKGASAGLFRPHIVEQPEGQCQVLFPLTELDCLIDKILSHPNIDIVNLEVCPYCNKPADGAMLCMGKTMAHSGCVIEELNKLLDPDYFGEGEPHKVVSTIPFNSRINP